MIEKFPRAAMITTAVVITLSMPLCLFLTGAALLYFGVKIILAQRRIFYWDLTTLCFGSATMAVGVDLFVKMYA